MPNQAGNVLAAAQQLDAATNDATLDVGELRGGTLFALLQLYHPASSTAAARPADVSAEQAVKDLKQLAAATVIRVDSVARPVADMSVQDKECQ